MVRMNHLRAEMLLLCDHVWDRLGFRKHVLGRGRVEAMTREAIRRWPQHPDSSTAQDEVHAWVLSQAAAQSGKQTYGFIWMAILSAVVGQIIRLLLEWWLESNHNRESMRNMRMLRELSE
jgi:hypothetical protein